MKSHFIRYGTPAEARFLLGKYLNKYDGLFVNANMLAHAPSAIATFIAQKSGLKTYIIDPQTHALQHDIIYLESKADADDAPGKKKIKSSIEKLFTQYGDPALSKVITAHSSVTVDDFKVDTVLDRFVSKVLNYQKETISTKLKQDPSWKFLEFASENHQPTLLNKLQPKCLVVPYFLIQEAAIQEILSLNIRFIRAAQKHGKNNKIAIQIVITRDVLRVDDLRKQLISAYQDYKQKVDYVFLWIDDFSEHRASERDLKAYISLLNDLAAIAPVINLYGSYFSVALSKSILAGKLIGVSHGLEYGESRAVIPVGGGIPTAKYYFPPAHMRMEFREAVAAINCYKAQHDKQKFLDRICDCPECKKIIAVSPEQDFIQFGETKEITYKKRDGTQIYRDFPLVEARQKSVRHYLWCKTKEYSEESTLTQIRKSLKHAHDTLSPIMPSLVKHLEIWAKVLSD